MPWHVRCINLLSFLKSRSKKKTNVLAIDILTRIKFIKNLCPSSLTEQEREQKYL